MPGTPAGQMRHRLRFERATMTRDAFGANEETAWNLLGYDRAKVLFGSGGERREAGVEGAAQSATFRVRANSLTRSITARDRIVWGGLNWDIAAIAPLLLAPAEIEFTGVASRG